MAHRDLSFNSRKPSSQASSLPSFKPVLENLEARLLLNGVEFDFGDAPDWASVAGYPTLLSNSGAYHDLGGPWLGDASDAPDGEPDGQPDPNAMGDDVFDGSDDENGVLIPILTQGWTIPVTVDVSSPFENGGYVDAWIDFNGDQTWDNTGERVFGGPLADGTHAFNVIVPADAVTGQTFARFRISEQGGLTPEGPGGPGEVEDYEVFIEPSQLPGIKWEQLPDLTSNGIDIRVDNFDGQRGVLADDFSCVFPSRLTDVHFWGSWLDDINGGISNIHLSIHSDDPAGQGGADPINEFSKPDELLWKGDFGENMFTESLYETVVDGEWWWDPVSGQDAICGADTEIWKYDIQIDPETAFEQTGTEENPVVYWLGISVDTFEGRFGWKTRQWPDHFMDDAVFGLIDSGASVEWNEMRYPEGHPYYGLEDDSIDMAFALTFEQFVETEIDVFPESVGQLLLEIPVSPGVVATSPDLPATDGDYRPTSGSYIDYLGPDLQVLLMDVRYRAFSDPPPVITAVGADEHANFQSSLLADAIITSPLLGLEGELVQMELAGPSETVTLGKADYTTGSFLAEIVEMTLVGDMGGGNTIMLRESPTHASVGETDIVDLGGGLYHIDSFFDVFTELSVDGGSSWMPATDSTRMDLVQPGVTTHSPELPAEGGEYRTSEYAHLRYEGADLEVVLEGLRHRPQGPVTRVDVGGDEIETFESSLCGTAVVTSSALGLDHVPVPVELTGPVETRVSDKTGNTTGEFQAEIVSMMLSGDVETPVGVIPLAIRENPTTASQGGASITDLGGGLYHIDSFFDVFTELSVDGGESWIAADASTQMELAPVPRLVPLVGPSEVHVFFEGNLGDAADDDGNGRDEVQTELVSMDLRGMTPWGAVRAGVRSDLPSTGQIEEQVQSGVGWLDVAPFTVDAAADSFFDVWPEIALGGQLLVTDEPLQIGTPIYHKPPQDGERYTNPFTARVELIDSVTGMGTGIYVLREFHQPSPTTEIDFFENTTALVELVGGPFGPVPLSYNLEGPAEAHVYFEGPTEGDAVDDDGNGLEEVVTQLVSMNLTDGSVIMRVRDVSESPFSPSLGRIEELANNTPGRLDVDPFHPGDAMSFFDVLFEIELPDGTILHNERPLRLQTTISEKPPRFAQFVGAIPAGGIMLFDDSNEPSGVCLVRAEHNVGQLEADMDFGDAPDSRLAPGYPTLLSNSGAYHDLGGPWLGDASDAPDGEPDGQPDPNAMGDDVLDGNDDENGVLIPILTQGWTVPVTVDVSSPSGNGGYIDAWIDFNGDQIWDNATERIFDGMLADGTNTIYVAVPADAVTGCTFARFRISQGGDLMPEGPGGPGEVEDYEVYIESPLLTKWEQWPEHGDDDIYDGWDELSIYGGQQIVADDWVCFDPNPVTDVHWWGSFAGWNQSEVPVQDLPQSFHIGIWKDVPLGADEDFSHPGELVWEYVSMDYTVAFDSMELDPRDPLAVEESAFYFETYLPEEHWFLQPGDEGIYWISISAQYDDPAGVELPWGWLTVERDLESPAPDDAVRLFNPTDPTLGGAPGPWSSGTDVFPSPDGQYRSSDGVSFGNTGVRINSLRLVPDGATEAVSPSDGSSGPVMVDSFFDVFYDITVTDVGGGGGGFYVDSFFDVFTELSIETGSAAGTFDTEIVLMNLSGSLGGQSILIREAPGRESLGGHSIEDLGGGQFHVDSFFDVFTELSVDGGETWIAADGPIHMAGSGITDVWAQGEPIFWPTQQESWDMAFVLTTQEMEAELDFGDAPDSRLAPGYPTLLANDGARHDLGGPRLGDASDAPDGEPDGQPDPNAMGDDVLDGNDDENGVQIPILTQGWTIPVTVDVSSPFGTGGYVDAWIDFNGDLTWDNTGERVFGGPLDDGTYTIDVAVPADAVTGWTFARFRISEQGGLSPEGPGGPGEVEDYEVFIEEEPQPDHDFGDAPEDGTAYPTTLARDGARHRVVQGFLLGEEIDAEWDGQPHPQAIGDDLVNLGDEDGVMFDTALVAGLQADITVNFTTFGPRGYLDAWVDFNGNGDWADAGERIFGAESLNPGANSLSFNVPSTAVTAPTFARFRLSTFDTLIPFGGSAGPGEVEDYEVMIVPNRPPTADANGPYLVDEGSTITLDASGSTDPDLPVDTLTYEWDLDGDGVYDDAAGVNPAFSAAGLDGPSVVPVALRVTDAGGLFDVDVATVAVRNVAPTLSDLALTPDLDEGETATLSGVVSDPGTPDTFTIDVDWGDGVTQTLPLDSATPGVTFNAVSGAFTVQHLYVDDGESPGNATASDVVAVTGAVHDDDGGSVPLLLADQGARIANDDPTGGYSDSQIDFYEPLGQSFTAISNQRLSTISLFVWDINASSAPTDYSLTFELFEGEGTSGRSLGVRSYSGLSDGFSGFVDLDYSEVTLLSGEMYTIVATNDTARWALRLSDNQYAGGRVIISGAATDHSDALFKVQWQAPAPVALLSNDDPTGGYSDSQVDFYEPLGQSFTAISNQRLSTISLFVWDINASSAPTDYSLTFELFEGEGTSGRSLGVRSYSGLSDGFSGFVDLDYSEVTLLAGEIYTIVATNDTARWALRLSDNQYAGGRAIISDAAVDHSDALFGVLWQPHPSLLSLRIHNVAPDFEAGPDAGLDMLDEGVFHRGITFTDPGLDDVHTVTVNYGDGTGDQTTTLPVGDRGFDLDHTYVAESSYTITVTVEDDDLGRLTDTFELSVDLNDPPTADANGPYIIAEGDSLVLDGTGSFDINSPSDAIVKFEWDLDNDGVFDDAAGETPTVPWGVLAGLGVGLGVHTIGLEVTDSFGLTDTDTAVLRVFQAVDFGDAPEREELLLYPTTLANNGARHLITKSGPFFGDATGRPDREFDGQPNLAATGDNNDIFFPPVNDDERGIVFHYPLIPGDPAAKVDIDMTGSPVGGVVNAWIDFDANGHWMEPYDQIITNAVLASGAIHTLTFLVPATAKTGYTYTRFRIANHGGLTPEGPAEDGEVEDYRIEVGQAGSDVVARHVFYNNSVWDGNNPAANSSDDGAIAPDKAVFLPVGPVLPANSSGYSKGINGIMVDIDNPGGTATVGDFGIRVNSASAPNTWSVGPVPVVSVRSGDGVGGSDRVTLVWPDGAILNQWIEVTVLSDANGGGLGLVDNDLFYFGNCVADVNGDGGVNSSDYGMLAGQFGRRGGIGELDADLNGDGRVDLNDFAAMRGAKGNSVPAPIFPAASPAAPTMGGGVGLDVPSATAEAASVAPETMNPETATAPALSVDLLVIPSMTDYIEDAPTRSGGAATRRPYREAAGQYDLRPLGDDPDAGAQGDDLLADILAESPLAPGL